MILQPIEITVYGAKVKCASCINLPSSLETKEWLEAALTRKYPNNDIHVRYVDIFKPETELDKKYVEKILDEQYFYPLVVFDNEVIAEGNPNLKEIYKKLENDKR